MQKQTQIEKSENQDEVIANDEFAQKKLTPAQNLALTLKVLAVLGAVGSLIWGLDQLMSP